MKYSTRLSLDALSSSSGEDPRGSLFANDYGLTDLSGVNIVGASVDTVRQLFYGIPNANFLNKLDLFVSEKEEFVRLTANDQINDDRWHFARIGQASGYRYKFQNNAVGLVILFGNCRVDLHKEGSHLKIELSPHFISGRTDEQIWEYLHGEFVGLSRIFLDNPVPRGVAVHLACDYQGFNLPVNFVQQLFTASRTVKAYDGIASIDLSDLSDAVATYGGDKQEKNYLIGKPIAIQMALYDKSYEMVKSDKVDYCQCEWNVYSLGTYDNTKPVRRIEARLHHTIIRECGLGLGLEFEGFNQVVDYLTDIWRYSLERNRLMLDKDLVHPFWQLLSEDVYFYVPAQAVKITRKKKEAIDPIAHNIVSVIGNLISILARQGMNTKRVMAQLRSLHIYPEILSYYRGRGLTEHDLREQVKKGLERRRLIGKAA